MNPNYIGVSNKIINLDAIAMIEDMSDDNGPLVVLTTTHAAEIELTGDDAEAVLTRAEFMLETTDALLARAQAITEVPQT